MKRSEPSNSIAPFSGVVRLVPAVNLIGAAPAPESPAAKCNLAVGDATPIPTASLLASRLNKFASVSPSILKSTSAPLSLATTAPVIDGASITAELIVLLVKVSVVSAPINVVLAFGKVIVLSAVGSVIAKVVSNPSLVAPSNISGLAP